MLKEIIRDYGRLVHEDDIFYCYINENILLTPEIVIDIHKNGLQMSEGNKYFTISDVSLNVSSTKEARAYGADNEYMANHIAYALIGNSLPVIILINFFINFNKPKVPTRLFRNEKDALDWFKKIKLNLPVDALH